MLDDVNYPHKSYLFSVADKLQRTRAKHFNEREIDYTFLETGETHVEKANRGINKTHVWSPVTYLDGGKKRIVLEKKKTEVAVADDELIDDLENATLEEIERAIKDGVCRAAIEISTKGAEFQPLVRNVVITETGIILPKYFVCIECEMVLENSGNGTANLNRHFRKCAAKKGSRSSLN